MSDMDRFDAHARAAREEAAAPLDVSGAVVARIQARDAAPSDERRALLLAAGLSLAAAAAVLLFALPWIDDLSDPMVQLLRATGEFEP